MKRRQGIYAAKISNVASEIVLSGHALVPPRGVPAHSARSVGLIPGEAADG